MGRARTVRGDPQGPSALRFPLGQEPALQPAGPERVQRPSPPPAAAPAASEQREAVQQTSSLPEKTNLVWAGLTDCPLSPTSTWNITPHPLPLLLLSEDGGLVLTQEQSLHLPSSFQPLCLKKLASIISASPVPGAAYTPTTRHRSLADFSLSASLHPDSLTESSHPATARESAPG